MAESKTQPTGVAVERFIEQVPHPGKREDAKVLDRMFREATGVEPKMWGPTIVGYGQYHYRYESGHEGDMCRVGFSPRKAKHSLYLLGCGDAEAEETFAPLLVRLGKHSRGVSCLYVNKLADIDLGVLAQMIDVSWTDSFARYPD